MGTVAAWIGVGECKPIAESALNNEENWRNKKEIRCTLSNGREIFISEKTWSGLNGGDSSKNSSF